MNDLDSIYFAARGLPPEERPAYLTKVCGGDPALRTRVEQMLAVADEAEAFVTDLPDVEPGDRRPGREPDKTRKLNPDDAPEEIIGQKIGRYKILERVGEGGCGVVYVAEQTEAVRRRVALKVIKLGMDTKQVVARFEAERQALAMMDHPNIAKVLDAGATDAGRPYFVMELVRGIRITDYCDQANLSTKERLDLFIKVCHAIQHAHQKGVIHRDIKPSNILVTLNDGAPVPKVIDFGIAKATEGRLTDHTVYTQLHQFVGTPAYMSPEQAEMSSLDIDTRSDIYSLGVLLYELLAGSTPFDARELMSLSIDAMRKTIREQEPMRPSTRLATLGAQEQTTTARRRSAETSKLLHQLKGDLDWIVMKCLEKDRRRRYETANGLAADLKRHLDNEAVVARPPSAAYKLQKAFRRNKLAFTAAAVVALVLVLGVVASTWQSVRATRAEKKATDTLAQVAAESDAKELARKDAEDISTFLSEVFQSPDPTRDGRTIKVVELLDRAAKKLDTDLATQPAQRAKLQMTLGHTYHALGLYQQAIPLQEKVRNYYGVTSGPEHPDTLTSMHELAGSFYAAGRRDEALKMQEETLALCRKVLGPEHPNTLGAMNNLAISYSDARRGDEALKLREEVLALRRKVSGPEHPETLRAMNNLAISYSDAGRRDEALKLREKVLALCRKVLGSEHPDTLMAMDNLTISYHAASRRDEAHKLREEVLELRRKVSGPDYLPTLGAMNSLANSYSDARRWGEALRLREDVLALCRKVLGAEHPNTLGAMNNLAISYFDVGRRDEALKLREEVLALRRKVSGSELPETLGAMNDLAISYSDARRWSEALKLREEMLALCRKVSGPEHPATLWAMNSLAMSYGNAGRPEEALKLREEMLTMTLKMDPKSQATAEAHAQLGFALDAAGRGDDAIKAWQEAVRIDPSAKQNNTCYWLGRTLVDRQRYAEALPILRATHKFYVGDDRAFQTEERLALAEAMAETGNAKSGAAGRMPGSQSMTAWLTALRTLVTTNSMDTDKAKHLATVHLWLGETNEHRLQCQKLLELAADSKDPTAHDRAAKACLIQADLDPAMREAAVAAGRRALKLASPNDGNRGWFLITAAMAELRDGKPKEAAPLLDEALRDSANSRERRGLALACRTLARAHLGRTNEARADFAELEKLIAPFPDPPAVSSILTKPDEMAAHLVFEEARALMEAQPIRKP